LILAAIFLITVSKSFAQNQLTDIFSNATQKYSTSLDELKTLASTKRNKQFNLKFTGGTSLNLLINMNEWNDENTHSIGGKLLDCDECYLTLTFYTDKGKPAVTGEIFSKLQNTAFKISLNEAGIISFEKTDKDKIIIE
jgi:hypothetical protein